MEEDSGRSLFRQKSLDSVSSPEKTDDYVRLPNPSSWLLAGAGALMTLGAVIYFIGTRI